MIRIEGLGLRHLLQTFDFCFVWLLSVVYYSSNLLWAAAATFRNFSQAAAMAVSLGSA